MSVLLVQSRAGGALVPYAAAEAQGRVTAVRQNDLAPRDFDRATGLITTNQLDQIGFLDWRGALAGLMARGGRWFFSGHVMRAFLPGLEPFRPIPNPKRRDLVLTRLSTHPIFAGIDQRDLEENRGVAGFYGRGHNPMPAGATAVNGIGPDLLPVDWDWPVPGGGRMFSHAGNELGGMGLERDLGPVLAGRIVAWVAGEI